MHTALLTLINNLRHRHGLAPLRPNSALDQAAQAYADDLATMEADYEKVKALNHTDSHGHGPEDRAQAAGYQHAVTENVLLSGSENIEATFTAWYDNPTHQEKMLQPWLLDSGLGYATSLQGRVYLVNLLGGIQTEQTPVRPLSR